MTVLAGRSLTELHHWKLRSPAPLRRRHIVASFAKLDTTPQRRTMQPRDDGVGNLSRVSPGERIAARRRGVG